MWVCRRLSHGELARPPTAAALGPMGSSKLAAGFNAADKVENTLERADSVATGVVRGDVGSMVTAAQAGSNAYKKSRRK